MSESNRSFKLLDKFLHEMVEAHQIPGAVYAILDKNGTLVENAVGFSHKDKKIPMTMDTLFDLASLTKVCATLPSIFLLIEKGRIDVDDPIQMFFPESVNGELTLRDLLTHTSGFPPSFPFYQYRWTKEEILNYILSINAEPGKHTVYSDLNFILLGLLVEKLTYQPLDVFTEESVYRPLGMTHTCFNPQTDLQYIAPTEWLPDANKFQWGEVHDENAHYMGGVSGHAGLFSNLHDLKIYVHMLMNEGKTEQGNYFISPATLLTSRKNYTKHLEYNRGLGWQLADDRYSPGGYYVSDQGYGHTGFTGTSFWIDPESDLGFILLSNRVHISRQINMNRIRRIVNNLAMSELAKK